MYDIFLKIIQYDSTSLKQLFNKTFKSIDAQFTNSTKIHTNYIRYNYIFSALYA